jgi:hypothetical protein
MLSEKLGNRGLAGSSPSNIQDEFNKRWVRDFRIDAVQFQKNQGGCGADTLVAVYEGMILNDVIKIGGGHFKKIGMQITAAETCLWHSDRGFQKRRIAEARTSTVSPDLIVMDLKDLVQTQEDRLHDQSANRLSARP